MKNPILDEMYEKWDATTIYEKLDATKVDNYEYFKSIIFDHYIKPFRDWCIDNKPQLVPYVEKCIELKCFPCRYETMLFSLTANSNAISYFKNIEYFKFFNSLKEALGYIYDGCK